MAAVEHNTGTESTLAVLAERLASLEFAALAAATQDSARLRLFDTLGALVVGLETPDGAMLRRHAEFAHATERTIAARCRLYVGATRATEIDDIDIGSCTTVGSVVVPVVLGVAATARACDGGRMLAAIVAGYEAMIALGRALDGATLLYRGVWPTYVTAAFGAAAATAKVLHLDAAATAGALALALTRTAPLPSAALLRPGFRSYSLGCAAADGIDAAFAAAAGVAADSAALEAFVLRCQAPQAALRARSAREPWLIHSVDTKLWPTSRQAQAGVAAFATLGVTPDNAESIEAIVVQVPAAYRAMVDRAAPPTQRLESMLGVQYQLALVTYEPEQLYDALRTSPLGGAHFERFMAKVEVRADEALSALFPGKWGARVTVRERLGRERTAEVVDPEGSAPRPCGWVDLERKYARIYAASGIGHKQGWLAALRARCERIDARSAAVDVATDLMAAVG